MKVCADCVKKKKSHSKFYSRKYVLQNPNSKF